MNARAAKGSGRRLGGDLPLLRCQVQTGKVGRVGQGAAGRWPAGALLGLERGLQPF